MKKKMTIEESFAKLDEMVRALESDEISLEDSFTLYEEGMKLLRDVNGRIDEVEKKIRKVEEDGTTEDFE
ncbi:MAG: exodeoxyribonuclease VII small subunit [Eubacteriales bacterium]